ncbi:MAG: hypothetical protein ACR2IF_15455 [Terriglobales bacterium]
MWRQYGAFVAYLAIQVLKAGVYLGREHPYFYFWAYWLGELLDVFLVVAIVYQIYSQLFAGHAGLRKLQDILFRWSAAMSIFVAVVVAASVPMGDSQKLMAGILAFDIAAAVLKVGLVAFLLILSSALALRWTHYAFGIAMGMGLYNSVELAVAVARSAAGPLAAFPYSIFKMAAWNCAVLVWLYYLSARDSGKTALRTVPENQLASWNQALLELLSR